MSCEYLRTFIVQFLGWFNKEVVQTSYWINSVCSSVLQDKSHEAQTTHPLVNANYGGDLLGADILAGLVNHENVFLLLVFCLHALGFRCYHAKILLQSYCCFSSAC